MVRISGLQTSKLAKKKRKQLYVRLSLFGALFISSIIGLSYLSAWSKITIHRTIVTGNDVINESDISKIAKESMLGKHLMLFSKTNKFVYPKEEIVANVSETYRRVKSISLDVEDNALIVTITEREPIGLWCDSEYVFNPEVKCYYIDEFGYIFEQAPKFSDDVYVTYIGNTKEHPVGTYFIPEDEFIDLVSFHQKIEDMGLRVARVVVKENDEYEIYVKNASLSGTSQQSESYILESEYGQEGIVAFDTQGDEGKILFNKRESFDQTFENLSTFLTDYIEKNDGELPVVDYIDLRFGNNIVFKFN